MDNDNVNLDLALAVNAHAELVGAGIDLMQADESSAERCVARIASAREQLLAAGDERAKLLASRLGLSAREMSIVWLMTAIAVRPDIRASAKLTNAEPGEDPTLACIQGIVYGASPSLFAMNELGPTGALRKLSVIAKSEQSAGAAESRAGWSLAPRILRWLLGDDSVDPDVAAFAQLGDGPAVTPVGDKQAAVEAGEMLRDGQMPIIIASGRTGYGRRTHLRSIAQSAGIRLLEVDVRKLSTDAAELAKQLCLVTRECKLLDLSPCLLQVDAVPEAANGEQLLQRVCDAFSGPVFITSSTNRPAVRCSRPVVVMEVKPLTTAERARLWLDELGQGTQEDADYLASQYPLAPALIHHAASGAKARAKGRKMQPEDIYAGVRAVLDGKLGDYARRVEITQSWDDIVLPEDTLESIRYLIARIRQRRTVYEQWGFAAKVGKGLGTSALFSGPPGTGKTMICALIALDLGLELYQVDMAKITSKYIGETERNLAALFDAAEAGQAILLFDEADSLFGKRTDVKSSNDRYANLETNYLLQRLESFTGICLLTSNHESAIDPAFMRRLSVHLRFELPEVEERAMLWQAMLPPAAPVASGIDFGALARRFVMSGGYIRNAALRAAFMAADEEAEITAFHLERAATLEYEGMGKIAF